jgi:hypothetical protein
MILMIFVAIGIPLGSVSQMIEEIVSVRQRVAPQGASLGRTDTSHP